MEPRLLIVPAAALFLSAVQLVQSLKPTHEVVPRPEEAPVPTTGVEIVGAMAYGERRDVAYVSPPKYRAVSFSGESGETVEARVFTLTAQRKGVAWIADDAFRRWEFPETDPTNALSLSLNLPHAGTYYVVVREAELRDATFSVSLSRATPHVAAR